jgi:hypothetical protein
VRKLQKGVDQSVGPTVIEALRSQWAVEWIRVGDGNRLCNELVKASPVSVPATVATASLPELAELTKSSRLGYCVLIRAA